MSEVDAKLSWTILGWVLDAIAAVALIFCIWCTKTVIALDSQQKQSSLILSRVEQSQTSQAKVMAELVRWQAATQASRFTNKDGQLIWKEIAEIHKQIAKQEVPQWLKDDLRQVERELEKLRK